MSIESPQAITLATWMVWEAVVEACLAAALMALVASKVLVVEVDDFEM